MFKKQLLFSTFLNFPLITSSFHIFDKSNKDISEQIANLKWFVKAEKIRSL